MARRREIGATRWGTGVPPPLVCEGATSAGGREQPAFEKAVGQLGVDGVEPRVRGIGTIRRDDPPCERPMGKDVIDRAAKGRARLCLGEGRLLE